MGPDAPNENGEIPPLHRVATYLPTDLESPGSDLSYPITPMSNYFKIILELYSLRLQVPGTPSSIGTDYDIFLDKSCRF